MAKSPRNDGVFFSVQHGDADSHKPIMIIKISGFETCSHIVQVMKKSCCQVRSVCVNGKNPPQRYVWTKISFVEFYISYKSPFIFRRLRLAQFIYETTDIDTQHAVDFVPCLMCRRPHIRCLSVVAASAILQRHIVVVKKKTKVLTNETRRLRRHR